MKTKKMICRIIMSLALLTPMKLLGQGAAPSSHLYYSGGNATSDIWMNQVYVPVTTLVVLSLL